MTTLLAPVALGSAWPARYVGRLYPGATILGLNVGGLTRATAARRLEERLTPYLAQPISFHLDEQVWRPTAAQLGLRVNLRATLDHACRHGRAAGLLRRYATLFDPADARVAAPVNVEIDSATLHTFFDQINDEVQRAPRDAHLRADDAGVKVTLDKAGRRLDIAAMQDAVLASAATLSPAQLPIVFESVAPAVTSTDLAESHAVAAKLIAAPIDIVLDELHWSVSTDQLAAALVLPDDPTHDHPSLDDALLLETLAPIADEVSRAPRDAAVAWIDGIQATSASAHGIEVDVDALVTNVIAAAQTDERSVTLPTRSISPAVDSDHLDALGISRRIATGSSSFAGSSDARATNVRVAADHVSQALIPPGATLSFNAALGPITLDEGYVEGKIISGDWYADDLGGGVCQVSTTVFRAALLAGFPFAEWHPHSFRLGFYELDGWPPGMDAAIYLPNTPDEWELDLRIVNPTNDWLLLQMHVDSESVAAEFFGGETRFAVDLSEPALGDPIPPPAPVERVSAELPNGDREQVQLAQPGLEVTVTRTVRLDGDVLVDDVFVSRYEPQAELWMVGASDA